MAAQVSHLLQTYIARLEEHAKPVANDIRYMSYVKYINAFLSCFCKERVYLVGSTGEGLKLKRSQNYGDADFIMCSGRLEIPIENIEERPDLLCYVKIRADNLRRDICGELICGYLSADMLRELRPELFTFLRAIFSEVTTNLDTMPGTLSRVTTIGLPMKVGLGAIEFRNLEIDGDILNKKWSNKRLKVDRDKRVVSKLKERWRNVQLNAQDMKITHRILKVIKLAKVPGSKGEHFGNINKFADDLDSVMKRIPLEQEQGPDNVPSGDHSQELYEDVSTMDEKIKATYTAMATRDFVPALRIIGDRKLACLVEWRKRVEKANWPPGDVAQKIFNTDVYLVARDAPLKADHSRDFCYSFNLAELKLAECLSTTQRQVYLILKSYLSGRLQKLHTGLGKSEMKFKTYYLKTSFFWVCEREDPSLWGKQNIITAVKKVLQFIMQCLQQKRLPHYFVNSNLFVELDDFECDVLQDCIRQILCEPIDSIGDFEFIKDNHGSMRVEILLDVDQVQCLSELKEDGGRIKHLDNLEDALIDIHRGFNESPRDVNGNVPIKEAVDKLFEVFIEEDRQKQISDGISNISIRGAEDGNSTQAIAGAHVPQTAAVAGLLNNFITGGRTLPMNSRESNQRMDLLLSIGSMFRGGPEIIASLGGQDGVRSVLQQTADRSVDPVLELKIVVGKYLSCSDEEEETLAQEILHKATAYFLARQE